MFIVCTKYTPRQIPCTAKLLWEIITFWCLKVLKIWQQYISQHSRVCVWGFLTSPSVSVCACWGQMGSRPGGLLTRTLSFIRRSLDDMSISNVTHLYTTENQTSQIRIQLATHPHTHTHTPPTHNKVSKNSIITRGVRKKINTLEYHNILFSNTVSIFKNVIVFCINYFFFLNLRAKIFM